MKHVAKILAAIVLLGIVLAAGSVGCFLYDWSREMSPTTYQPWLDASPTAYINVDSIAESDLPWFAYAYDENEFVDAIPNATRLPKIADSSGRLPAFKLGDDIFILTWKWVNSSAGLAISEDGDFKNRIESLDHRFRVRHISANVYEWDLDLETPHPDENAG